METKGQITFFVSERGNARFFEGSISRKNQDGSYAHARIDIEFGKQNFSIEKLNALKVNTAYTMDVDSGFLSVASYKNKEGKQVSKVILHVEKGNLVKQKACEVKPVQPKVVDKDLPF